MKTSSRCVICNEIDRNPKLSHRGECADCFRARKLMDFVMPVVAILEENDDENDDE